APESIWRVMLFGGPEETQLAYLGVPHDYLLDDHLRKTNFLAPGETDTFVQPQLQVMNDRRLAPGLFLRNTVYAILGEGYFGQFEALTADGTIQNAWSKRALGNRQVGWIPRISWAHHGGELTAGMELLFHRGRHDGKVTGDLCLDPACTTTAPLATPQVLYDY